MSDPIGPLSHDNACYGPDDDTAFLPSSASAQSAEGVGWPMPSGADSTSSNQPPSGTETLLAKFYAQAPRAGQPTVDLSAPTSREGNVWLCGRPAQINALKELGLEHRWLMTTSKEAGMGAVGGGIPGNHLDSPFVTQTSVNDHAGEHDAATAHCEPIGNVAEECVNARLSLGTSLGRWTPDNQCQTFAEGVLNSCTPESEQSDGAEGARGY